MRSAALIAVLLLFCIRGRAQELYPVSWSYKDLTFKEFVEKAEATLPVRFYFKDEWIDSLKLPDYRGCPELTCILDKLLAGTSLYYYIDRSGNIILTKDFAVKRSIGEKVNQNLLIPASDIAEMGEGAETYVNSVVTIGTPADRYGSGNVTISGYIKDLETGGPVSGVTVYIQKLSIGTFTNDYGYYSLTVPRGVHLVQFSFVGMKEKKVTAYLYGSGDLNVEMKSVLIPIRGVVVSGQRNLTMKRFETGLEKINIATFRLMPTTLGETDVLKSILLIPGVQSVGEGSAGFNVRGGAADQNLILIDGAPVHNPSHFFGFFSSINADIIKDVTLYKGGIPGRFGGRLSSVLDVQLKDGSKNDFAGKAGISPITANIVLEGPIIRDTLSYLLAGRTTYSNWIFGLIKNPLLHNSTASFSDLNGKLTWSPNQYNKIELSSYYSNDSFSYSTEALYNYVNSVSSLKWLHFFTGRFFTAISLNNSFYKYSIATMEFPEEANSLTYSINTTEFKTDFRWFSGRNELNYGLDITAYFTNPGSITPFDSSSLIIPRNIEKERALEPSVYIDDKFTLTDYLSISAGLRVSGFFSFGPQTVLKYDPVSPRSPSSVTDTIYFKPGEISSEYMGPELRLSVNLRLSDNNSLKVNYNRMRQNIIMLSNTTSISPTDTWKLCDYYLKPQIGDQLSAGFYQMVFGNKYELSAEAYYKKLQNMTDYKGMSSLTMIEHAEQSLFEAEGKAYGFEFSFKKNIGKIRYFIGYTFARTYIRSTGKFSEEIVNSGEWYPANYDRPNDLIVTFNYLFSRRFSFSCNYLWSDGRPVTFPISKYYVNNIQLVHYSDRNLYRIPDYSRFDISFRVNGNLRSHKIANPNWTFSVYNLFGRDNIYSVYFKREGANIKGYSLSVFDRAIPSVTFNFDF
jgi:hypothetical protein